MNDDPNFPEIDSSQLESPISSKKPSTWLDLILYLIFGFGIQIGLMVIINIFHPINLENDLGLVEIIIAILVPFISFVLTFYFFGILRGRISLTQIGLRKIDWDWKYSLYAIGLIIVFMPVRLLAALGVEYILYGNVDFTSLENRNDFFGTFSDIPFGFGLMLIGVGVLAPIAEELFFRGLIYNWFRDRSSTLWSVVLSSLLFGFAHYDSAGVVASSFVMGAVIAFSYEKTKSLWLPILIHVFTNSGGVVMLYIAIAIQESGLLPNL